jgi:hypothetical protein
MGEYVAVVILYIALGHSRIPTQYIRSVTVTYYTLRIVVVIRWCECGIKRFGKWKLWFRNRNVSLVYETNYRFLFVNSWPPFQSCLGSFTPSLIRLKINCHLLTIWLNLALFWLFGIFKDPVAMAIRTVKPDFAVPVDTARPFVNVNWRLVSVASFLMGGSSTLSISCVRATSAWSAGSRTQTKSATLRPTKKTTVSIGPTARKWRFLNKYRHS